MSLRRRATSSTSSSVSAVDRRGLPRWELPLKSIRQRDSWPVRFEIVDPSVEDASDVKQCRAGKVRLYGPSGRERLMSQPYFLSVPCRAGDR